jgi:hypothetical protein
MSKPIRRRPPATIIRPRPPSPVDAGPPAAPGRQPGLAVGVVDEVERRLSGRRLEPMMLLLPLDVASELLLDELEAELQHRGGILDRHTGPIGQSPPTVTPSFSAAPWRRHRTRRSRPASRGTGAPVLSQLRRAITAAPFCRAAPRICRCAVRGRRRRCALMSGCLGCRDLSVSP